jgi:exopolyphosphatase/guanosine-5'-triphosphate,3'-diphosphate pyrophosphatase
MATASSSSNVTEVEAADPERAVERSTVIDLGSNTFRLVVYSSVRDAWWKRTDEIVEGVRIGAGTEATGALSEEAMDRALHTLTMYARFCTASGIEHGAVKALATSAIRDATNRMEFLRRAEHDSGLEVRVLTAEEEAWYGYLGAANTSTLRDGAVFDLGGGSAQLTRVEDRHAVEHESWRLGAVRMTERFLGEEEASKKQLKALRRHAREELAKATWFAEQGPRIVAIGGTARNLAAAAQRLGDLPSFGVQGHVVGREALDAVVEELAARPASKRGEVPGIKPSRADVILAGATVFQAALDVAGSDAFEVTDSGLREGVFFSSYLAPADPPLFEDVRRASVLNLARQYGANLTHAGHVAKLALELYDGLAEAGVHKPDDEARELLWAASIVHDIGVSVDYDNHHKHTRYLVLSAGLPGFTPREVALIGQMARYHRKGTPSPGRFAGYMGNGDAKLLTRCATLLRLAEQLERSRDQLVESVRVSADDDRVVVTLTSSSDLCVARWSAERMADAFAEAFGRRLEVAEP